MADLFDPLTQRGVTYRNRIGISPMCMYASRDGTATEWHVVHLGSRAVGGAGMVMVEATGVEPRGRISPVDSGLWSDDQTEGFARVASVIRDHGAVAAIQLAHAGRKGSTTPPWQGDRSLTQAEGAWQTIGPSAIPFDPPGGQVTHTPTAMTADDIATVCRAFRDATVRADEAGFDMVELHNAHGYLLHSFLSPHSNRRTDAYGGSFDNRVRFTLETVRAMREVWPERKPLWLRLSCVDWIAGGWTIEESIALARRLKGEGVDLIDCSSGWTVPGEKPPFGPGWQVPFADRIRREAGIATAAVGEITAAHQADEIITSGKADMVLLATESLRDPYWPYHAAMTLGRLGALRMPIHYDYVIRPQSRAAE
ncbi:MAG: NADH:flavin oxidoreductase/NADH oxidase [Alphaproteobacteria bacterium]|nr:NADH:flavin oxidoreductase/NADH oxidase [Alphaproteobacteria bacterium]